MRKYYFTFIGLFLCATLVWLNMYPRADFETQYETGIKGAISFLDNHKNYIHSLMAKAKLSPKDKLILFSAIYPELVVYQQDKGQSDKLAIALNQLFLKTSFVGFSVGPFQMKPLFMEKLNALGCISAEEEIIDMEKMALAETQFHYLICFYQSLKLIHPKFLKLNEAEQIRFVATAYNAGFDMPTERIIELSKKKIKGFPYSRFPFKYFNKWNYASLAVQGRDYIKNSFNRTTR